MGTRKSARLRAKPLKRYAFGPSSEEFCKDVKIVLSDEFFEAEKTKSSTGGSTASSHNSNPNSPFADLPPEIVYSIFSKLSPKDLLNLCLVSKSTRELLNPNLPNGMRIWKATRETMGFPDPQLVELSNFAFLKTYYTFGCSFCSNSPRTRQIFWRFRGKRICNNCILHNFVRHSDLSCPEDYCRKLPYIIFKEYSKEQMTYRTSRMYYRPQIPTRAPSKKELEKRAERLGNFHRFMFSLAHLERDKARDKRRVEAVVKSDRRSEMKQYLKAQSLDEGLFVRCPTFQRYAKIAKPFTSQSAKTRLLKAVKRELRDFNDFGNLPNL